MGLRQLILTFMTKLSFYIVKNYYVTICQNQNFPDIYYATARLKNQELMLFPARPRSPKCV
jgi:hypothetical protein